MIVMKFGGSSLASADSIGRVVSIIRSETNRHPVVVASAMGDTTDFLVEILGAARKADTQAVWKLEEQVKNGYFAACEELLHGPAQSLTSQYLRETFRDLHVRMLELCEGERTFTPELQDWTVSLGEQLSSRLLAAVLQEHCGHTSYLDSRKLILTDGNFTDAQPRYWETYAKIRWSIPLAARDRLVVLGGFIGSTEDGRTTTLGRGGSDLTASIVGAAINADEIQVWKDVDGMLTCDPRKLRGGHQVKRLSYEEASELASAGATILHPQTMEPAKRLRIPIVIRNTFRPSGEGTRIESSTAEYTNVIKSIAIQNDVNLLEVCSAKPAEDAQALSAFCKEHASVAAVLCSSERAVYLAVHQNATIPEESLAPGRCLEVKVRSEQAILTLVGQVSNRELMAKKLNSALGSIRAFVIPAEGSSHSVRLAVPREQLQKCINVVHGAFFSNPDPRFFVVSGKTESKEMAGAKIPLRKRSQQSKPTGLPARHFQVN